VSIHSAFSFVGRFLFFLVNEDHHVGVLFDRAGFTQVRQLRALIVARFDLARQLRQRQDRNVELLGQRLEPRRDLGDLLHTTLAGALARALQQLQVIDHQEIEAALTLKPARTCGKLADREAAGFIDIKRQILQLDRNVLDFLEIGFVDPAAADFVWWDAGLLGDGRDQARAVQRGGCR